MDDEELKPVALVVDLSMSAEARRQLVRKINDDADLPAGCGFMLSVLSAITLIILHFAIGLNWWWMFASTLPTLIGGVLTAGRNSQLGKLDDSHFVRPSDLDKSSSKLLFQAQDAIRTILGSGVNARNSLDRAAEEPGSRTKYFRCSGSVFRTGCARLRGFPVSVQAEAFPFS